MRDTAIDLTFGLLVGALLVFGFKDAVTTNTRVVEILLLVLFALGAGLGCGMVFATEAAFKVLDKEPHFDFARAMGANDKAKNTLMAGVRLIVLWLFILAGAYYAAGVWPNTTALMAAGFSAIVLLRLIRDAHVLWAIWRVNRVAERRLREMEQEECC